jgi:hypothetical protein
VLEQVTDRDTAGRLIGSNADELRAFVGGADSTFSELAADVVRFLVAATGELPPDLLLAGMVVGSL